MRSVIGFLACGIVCIALGLPVLANGNQPEAQLKTAAREHLQRAVRHLRPNETNKAVTHDNGQYVATYLVLDEPTLQIEAKETAPGEYVGSIVYVVHEYRCVGATEQEARVAQCQRIKSRKMREYTRYADGNWLF